MPADASVVRQNYTIGLQNVSKLMLQLNTAMNSLSALYNGDGLSGTFVDAELATSAGTKHLLAADVGTFTANLITVQAAMSTPILQNMAKCVGNPV